MKIIIDADACPVVDIATDTAKKRNIECVIVCDNTHSIQKDGAVTVTVDKVPILRIAKLQILQKRVTL